MKQAKTKEIAVLAMLTALAFVAVALLRVPVFAFLKYEPKDVVLVLGGFLYGPAAAAILAALTSLLEMLTISDTGLIGFVMNFLSSAAFACKPAAAVASARRAGTTASIDALGKYFGISRMLTVGSTYWSMVHGNCPADVLQDLEGLQTMRNLAREMAWLMRCIETARAAGICPPTPERTERTNFIR